TWQPRRTASATAEAEAASEPSGASITTRSRLPAQPGSPGPGQATNGTGHHGSSTARSRRASGPAALTGRGRASPGAAVAWATSPAASLAASRTRAPDWARWRSTWSAPARAASSSRRDSSNQSVIAGPSGRTARLVDQQHRDVVAHRVGQAAAGADQLLLDRVELGVAVRADDDVEQRSVDVPWRFSS